MMLSVAKEGVVDSCSTAEFVVEREDLKDRSTEKKARVV